MASQEGGSRAKIFRWDKSLAFKVPPDLAAALQLRVGDDVDLRAGPDGGIVIDRRVPPAAAGESGEDPSSP